MMIPSVSGHTFGVIGAVGFAVGSAVGSAVGTAVGFAVGSMICFIVGSVVGSIAGSAVGPNGGSNIENFNVDIIMIILINDRLKYKYLLIEMDGIRTHRRTIHFIMNLIEYLEENE